jgi:hypothetical protein
VDNFLWQANSELNFGLFIFNVGWTEEGLEYFNDIIAQLVEERSGGNGDGDISDLELFEDECMKNWKQEIELKEQSRKGKKRLSPQYSDKAKKYLVVAELCREFGVAV